MTLEACYIERRIEEVNKSQETARNLASKVRDALISFHKEIVDTRGYMVFSFPFNELSGIGGEYLRQQCLKNGANIFRDSIVVARAVYFTNSTTKEEDILASLDNIMDELGMNRLPLQG